MKGAPKGNQFWKLRSKHGRDKLFKTPDLLWEAACDYFENTQNNPLKEDTTYHYQGSVKHEDTSKPRPFTIHGLCLYLGVNTIYFNRFMDELKGKEDELSLGFCEVITRIRETIYLQKFEGSAAGFFNPNIIARDLGLIDKQDVDAKLEVTKRITKVEIVKTSPESQKG